MITVMLKQIKIKINFVKITKTNKTNVKFRKSNIPILILTLMMSKELKKTKIFYIQSWTGTKIP